jgi:hypothetical protein
MKFEKGQSGNPKGKPKETELTFNDLLLRNSVKAYKLLWAQLRQGEPWAFEIYFTLLSIELKEMEDIADNCPMCNDLNSKLKRKEQLHSFHDN